LRLCNGYLGYLADRRYSPASVRAYGFDLLHFARWLAGQGLALQDVDTDALLRYLAGCRAERRPGPHDNVISLASGRATGFAPATINRRLAAISGLFSFRSMRDPAAANPMPRGPAAGRAAAGERAGLLAHLDKPKPRSKLRVREPRRLAPGLDRAETAALLSSFRADRDRAMAGLMHPCYRERASGRDREFRVLAARGRACTGDLPAARRGAGTRRYRRRRADRARRADGLPRR
jgi:Phage integrase, N-terminal SAM-like domain